MRIGLFVPCYVDQLAPRVGMAALEVLERHGVGVDFPEAQTCCGQPLWNAGDDRGAAPLARRFVEIFAPCDWVVAPSASCVAMVRHHYPALLGDAPGLASLGARTLELCEFLVDVLGIERAAGRFPHRVALQPGCHGLRELRLGSASERMAAGPDKVGRLLAGLDGLELVRLERPDECCGFGGSFALAEEAVSARMGLDRIEDCERAGGEVLTSTDASCLLHLEGLLRRRGLRLRAMHVAEILAEAGDPR